MSGSTKGVPSQGGTQGSRTNSQNQGKSVLDWKAGQGPTK